MSLPSAPICCSCVLLLAFALGETHRPLRADDASVPEFSAADLEYFEKEVRPILANRCYECHSGQAKNPKGGLRVDSRAALLTGGDTGPAIDLKSPRQSLLVDAINYGQTYQMPPKTRLPAAEIATLTKWVERGAAWPQESSATAKTTDSFDLIARQESHWCWRPAQAQTPPAVRESDWPRQDFDRFILAGLEERGMTPAPSADRRTLARRVYFDLIGLPPTVEQVEDFARDQSPQAFANLVDELLKSPHFGERWARHWMDLVRYAETCGHEFDFPIHNAWRYRDYLIRAFNTDLPYDQFVVEQIAGDLLPQPRLNPASQANESIVGTGFWWLHEALHAPVDVRGDEANRIDNQIDVFSKTFLGITVACARCHDHKFDAISTKDYYALAGVLKSTRRQEALLDPGGKIRETAERVAALRQECSKSLRSWVADQSELSADSLRKYLFAAREVVAGEPGSDEPPAAAGQRRDVASVARQFDLPPQRLQSWVVALIDPKTRTLDHPLRLWSQWGMETGEAPGEAKLAAWREQFRLEQTHLVEHMMEYRPFVQFASQNGSFGGWTVTGEAWGPAPAAGGEWDSTAKIPQFVESNGAHSGQLAGPFQGVLRSPTFTIDSRNIFYRVAGENCEVRLIVDGYTMIEFHQLLFGGCKFPVNTEGKWVWHRQAGDLGMYQGHRAYIEVVDHGNGWAALDQVWFSNRETPPEPAPSAELCELAGDAAVRSLDSLAGRLAAHWSDALRRWKSDRPSGSDLRFVNWLFTNGLLGPASIDAGPAVITAKAKERIAESIQMLPAPERVTAAIDGTGEDERVFIRGNPRILGEAAPRQLLSALVGKQPPIEQGSGRLILARQVADPANPLTARVLVNRVWHHLFGAGIVPPVDNFGVLGEPPTHPELLDHLAGQFVVEGWSIKRLIRALVLSSTYQMTSAPQPAADEADPANRLWHRMNIRRLEGEAIRDAILVVSGRLDRQLYGPGVAVHITPFMQGRGKPANSGPLDGGGRRSLYTEVRRNFLSPMMLAFDTPIPFNTVGRRNTSNVPAQALILMNDPFVVEQAQRWSRQLLARKDLSFEELVARAYLAAISRPPAADELSDVRQFFATQARDLAIPETQAARDPRVWTDFCHVLFNLKEFAYLQ